MGMDSFLKFNSYCHVSQSKPKDWFMDGQLPQSSAVRISIRMPRSHVRENLEKPPNSSSLTEITTKCPPTLSTLSPQSLFLSVRHPPSLPTSSLQSLPFPLLLQNPFPYHTLKPHGLNPFAPNPALIYSVKPFLRTLK